MQSKKVAAGLDESDVPKQPLSSRLLLFRIAFFSLGLLWLAFPPLGFAWLAWLAPIPLVWICMAEQLPSQRPYRQLYFAGLLYWLATFYFIPIPHPALWLGWLAVSAYMAIYIPLQVAIARTMIHRWRIPVWLAVPIAWTGVEYFRCFFASGMAMVCLSHSQFKYPLLIQVADLSGAYTLTFVMMMVAAAVATWGWPWANRLLGDVECRDVDVRPRRGQRGFTPLLVALGGLALVLGYGQYRLAEELTVDSERGLVVGIIQTSEDVIFGPQSSEQVSARMLNQQRLTHQARTNFPDLDLVLWPESGFNPVWDLLEDMDPTQTKEFAAMNCLQHWAGMTGFPDKFEQPLPMLTGALSYNPRTEETFNAALYFSERGDIEARYFKNHLVMFGEYVPLMDWFPAIKKLSPIGNTAAGAEFSVIEIKGVKIAPSVCFETTIPHLIRRQVNSLAAVGSEPDVLVNLTNDGWFFGTSCLDLHLACNVFRAIEMRKPHLVCANTGFSAEIDTCGRLLQLGPRRAEATLRSEVNPVKRTSLYRSVGDSLPLLLLLLCGLAIATELFRRNDQTRLGSSSPRGQAFPGD